MAQSQNLLPWPPEDLASYYGSEHFHTQLKRVASYLLKKYKHQDTELIVFNAASDALIRAIKEEEEDGNDGFLRFKSERHFIQSILITCKHRIIDLRKSFNGRIKQFPSNFDISVSTTNPAELADQREYQEQLVANLEKALNGLTSVERSIILLVIDGNTSKEIAERLNMSVSKIYKIKHTAMKKLAIVLDRSDRGGDGQ